MTNNDFCIILSMLVAFLLIIMIIFVFHTKRKIEEYEKKCSTYATSFEDICNTSIGCLHISKIDEHEAPGLYLEIYKNSYQKILDRSKSGCCIVLDCVVDSQDKQAL